MWVNNAISNHFNEYIFYVLCYNYLCKNDVTCIYLNLQHKTCVDLIHFDLWKLNWFAILRFAISCVKMELPNSRLLLFIYVKWININFHQKFSYRSTTYISIQICRWKILHSNVMHYYSTNCNTIQIWSWCSWYLSSVGNRNPAIYVASYVGRKGEVKKCRKRFKNVTSCFVINLLNNKTIILLNLAEYRLILSIRRYSARFRSIIVNYVQFFS